jgi:hypothetical protein
MANLLPGTWGTAFLSEDQQIYAQHFVDRTVLDRFSHAGPFRVLTVHSCNKDPTLTCRIPFLET